MIEQAEGAKFWLKVFNEIKTRRVDDLLIAVVDGLKGLAEFEAGPWGRRYPTIVQSWRRAGLFDRLPGNRPVQ